MRFDKGTIYPRYARLYWRRKEWARITVDKITPYNRTPPQMNGGKPWRHSGRFKFLMLRKTFKWESLYA